MRKPIIICALVTLVAAEQGFAQPKIAFTSTPAWGQAQDIYVVDIRGNNATNLTQSDDADADPVWSPDGRRIAFISNRGGDWNLYSMNADGTDLIQLTNATNSQLFMPAWSPDGQRIAYAQSTEGSEEFDIFAINADGSNAVNLTNSANDEVYPAWSPDSQRLAYIVGDLCGTCFGEPFGDIVVLDIASGETSLLTDSKDIYFPTWSPDGQRLAFVSDRDGNQDIWSMAADGSDPVNLTQHPEFDSEPSWSPDGRQIAFLTVRDGNSEIYLMDADGSNQINLTNRPDQDMNPNWLPVAPTSTLVRALSWGRVKVNFR